MENLHDVFIFLTEGAIVNDVADPKRPQKSTRDIEPIIRTAVGW